MREFVGQLDTEFSQWQVQFRDMANLILPRRFVTLYGSTALTNGVVGASNAVNTAENNGTKTNSRIFDPTATTAARVLAQGLMNGITSPVRPWFRIRLKDFPENLEDYPHEYYIWLEEVARRMHIVLSESNFYGSIAITYLELVVFGTAVMLIYDDFGSVIHCYNSPCGEYRLGQNNRREVSILTRHFSLRVHQVVQEFGLEHCSAETQSAFKQGGASLQQIVGITHHVAEKGKGKGYAEYYWETGRQQDSKVLRIKTFTEKPMIAARWEVTGNDSYGHSPTMDAIPEIRQLQIETKQKTISIDKMVRPPIVADVALSNNPTSLLPGGISYVPSSSSVGAKPIYTVDPPLEAMTNDIRELQGRIKEIYYNHLFRNVSQLTTVRSAQEISERKSEDMVLLATVLQRFGGEALDPALRRVYGIMDRQGLIPEPPAGLNPETIDIQYVSILFDAQRAVSVASIERGLAVVGQTAAVAPDVLDIPYWDELIREYWTRLNIPAITLNGRDRVAQIRQEKAEAAQAEQGAQFTNELTNAAKNLSETDTGDGTSLLSGLLG